MRSTGFWRHCVQFLNGTWETCWPLANSHCSMPLIPNEKCVMHFAKNKFCTTAESDIDHFCQPQRVAQRSFNVRDFALVAFLRRFGRKISNTKNHSVIVWSEQPMKFFVHFVVALGI